MITHFLNLTALMLPLKISLLNVLTIISRIFLLLTATAGVKVQLGAPKLNRFSQLKITASLTLPQIYMKFNLS